MSKTVYASDDPKLAAIEKELNEIFQSAKSDQNVVLRDSETDETTIIFNESNCLRKKDIDRIRGVVKKHGLYVKDYSYHSQAISQKGVSFALTCLPRSQ